MSTLGPRLSFQNPHLLGMCASFECVPPWGLDEVQLVSALRYLMLMNRPVMAVTNPGNAKR